jgi:hypothetical protein
MRFLFLYQKPGFYMFQCPDSDADAEADVWEPGDNQSPDVGTLKTTSGRCATPMNFAPVREDRSPGKLTNADYVTIADSDEDLDEPDPKARKAVKKNVMPIKTTPAPVKRKETPAPMPPGIKSGILF